MTDPHTAILAKLADFEIPTNFTRPPLPPILDPDLAVQVFTHSSYYNVKRKTMTECLGMDEEILDNEKLEHVGDGILGE